MSDEFDYKASRLALIEDNGRLVEQNHEQQIAISRLMAECAKYRAALQEIADADTDWTEGPDGNMQRMRNLAEAALSPVSNRQEKCSDPWHESDMVVTRRCNTCGGDDGAFEAPAGISQAAKDFVDRYR